MEKKKKGKGIIIVIIILALVVGGYFVYDNFFSGSITTEDIEAVEVKKVGFYPTEDIYFDLDDYKSDFFKILDSNDAYYYIAENAKGGIVVKQVNREDFDNFGPVKSSKAINTVKKGLKTFGIIVLVLLIILAIIVGGTFAFVHSKLSKMQQRFFTFHTIDPKSSYSLEKPYINYPCSIRYTATR